MWSALATTIVCAASWALHQREAITIPGLESLEQVSSDVRFRLRGAQALANDRIVIVGVDDATRAEFPEVFHSRAGWAALLRAIAKHGPRAIGLDLIFGHPEVNLPANVIDQVRQAQKALASDEPTAGSAQQALAALTAVLNEVRGDDTLAEAIAAAANVRMGVVFGLSDRSLGETNERPGLRGARVRDVVVPKRPGATPFPANSVRLSLAPFMQHSAGAGALNVARDSDGKVRRAHAILEYRGRYYQAFAVSMAQAAFENVPPVEYIVGDNTLHMGPVTAPLSHQAEAFVSHLGPNGWFPRVSAADILARRVAPNTLTDKLVFVGFTDTLRDKLTTPLEESLDGVELHATFTHNILHNQLLRPASPWMTLLALLVCGGILTVCQTRIVRKRHSWIPGVALLIVVGGYLVATYVAFRMGVIAEVVPPVACSVFVALASLSTALATEGREKAQLRAAFAQYVSDALVEQIVRDPAQATLGGERRELTVMFSDIRGFSRFSEQLEPEALSAYLNEYLTPMTDLVRANGGMLDKYIGDAIMAVYGAPVPLREHAIQACATALAMLEALEPLNRRWKQQGLPTIQIGIGINSGPMAIGNMGSEARFDYTAIGDAVNLCARLEPLTKQYQVPVLVGETTAEFAASAFLFREIDLVRVVGRDTPARVLELIGPASLAPAWQDDINLFESALADYRSQQWDSADSKFLQLLARRPSDGPASVLRARLDDLRQQSLPPDWDGVFAHHSK